MKTFFHAARVTLLLLIPTIPASLFAQGTAFTYQGQLNSGNGPANGTYDFRFRLASDPLANNYVGSYLTNGIIVSNGLFVTTMDFGPAILNGSNYWLEIDLRTNGTVTYTDLTPLQQLTPAPYAVFATSSSNMLGVLPAGQLSGSIANGNLPASPSFSGTVTANAFSGDGVNVSSVNALALNGLVSSNFWQLGGNNVGAGQFLGSTNNQPIEIWVNHTRAARYEPGVFGDAAPNFIGGSPTNFVADGVTGATISGGGTTNYIGFPPRAPRPNSVTDDFGTVGGGANNTAAYFSTVSGGVSNSAMNWAAIGGGLVNTAESSIASTIAGGSSNVASGTYSSIGGGLNNTASGLFGTVAGGTGNTAGNFDAGAVGGGSGNVAGGDYSTAAGGLNNTASGHGAFIGGGGFDGIGFDNSDLLGNQAAGDASVVVGGFGNKVTVNAFAASIGGGEFNTNYGNIGTIAGGQNNNILQPAGTVYQPAIGGGYGNVASNSYTTVPGGILNIAGGEYSFAAGRQAQALHQGSFVWADSQNSAFASTANDQFNVRAQGGVRFVTSGAGLTADGFPVLTSGGGSGITIQQNSGGAPDIIEGGPYNIVASGVVGAVIGGGGTTNYFGLTGPNMVLSDFGTVSGGFSNVVENGQYATVGGGYQNTASYIGSTVAGGYQNITHNQFATVAGGLQNVADLFGAVGGGESNVISAGADHAVIGGGSHNKITGYESTIGGGYYNSINAQDSVIAGGDLNVINSGANQSFIGGGISNTNFASLATIGGGSDNSAGASATVGGGGYNYAGSLYATVGGGNKNTATNQNSTVAGGYLNVAGNSYSTVGGGNQNKATGLYSTVAGGFGNKAMADYSFAAGNEAQAVHQGAFVWSDSEAGVFNSTTNDEFSIRATNGVRILGDKGIHLNANDRPIIVRDWDVFGTNAPSYKVGIGRWGLFMEPFNLVIGIPDDIAGRYFQIAKYSTNGNYTTLVLVDQAGDLYATNNVFAKGVQLTSDRNAKEHFAPLDAQSVLAKVTAMPVTEWNYKSDDADTKHIGPVAQDFHAAFGLNGPDDKHISAVDESGVALAAIQGLNQKVETLTAENSDLKQRLAALEKIVLSREKIAPTPP